MNVPLITSEPFSANFNGDPSEQAVRAIAGGTRQLQEFMIELLKCDCIAYVSLNHNRIVVMSFSDDWDGVEKHLFSIIETSFGFDRVQRVN